MTSKRSTRHEWSAPGELRAGYGHKLTASELGLYSQGRKDGGAGAGDSGRFDGGRRTELHLWPDLEAVLGQGQREGVPRP